MLYPFTTINLTLLHWRSGDIEDVPLPNEGEEELDDAGEPKERFPTEEAYQSYVIGPFVCGPQWNFPA
jgi:hypothetical protein